MKPHSRRFFIKSSVAGLSLFSAAGLLTQCNRSPEPESDKGAQVRVVNGVPELFVNGELQSRMWGRLALPGSYGPEKLTQYRDAGIKTYFTSLDATISLCWNGRDEFYFDLYEVYLRRLVEKMSDIQLILYVGGSGGAPYLWARDHEEDLTLYDNGRRFEAASIASEAWIRDSSWAFGQFVKHFENSKYAKNIIGYNPIYNANEWFSHHRASGEMGGWPDFSAPMLKRFRSWLRQKYVDVGALREAWNDSNVTFDNVDIPPWPERLRADDPDFFTACGETGSSIADYFMCYDDALADLGISYCRAIKEAAPIPKLAGMMHAYSFCGRYDIIPHHHGHGAAQKIMQSEYVDFLHSPYHYYNRSLGGPHYSQHSADSVVLHGKLMVDQIDSKPHLRHGPNHNASTPWEDEQLLKRDAAYSLTKNFHCYWLEGGPGDMFPIVRFSPKRYGKLWYDDPEIKATIGTLKKWHDENQAADTQNVTEVALFASSRSFFYRKLEDVHGKLYTEAFRQWILPEAGAPFDDYILEDFPSIDRGYKVYIFVDAYHVPALLRQQIRDKLSAEGATALWFYAPGYSADDGCSLDHCEELSGIRLNKADHRDYVQVTLTDYSHPLLSGLQNISEYGSDADPDYFQKGLKWLRWPKDKETYKFTPVFYADDPQAETLGILNGVGKPGLVVKKNGEFTSVFSSAPLLPSTILVNILDKAGVHLYSRQKDLVYANSHYVAVCANTGGGQKTLHLAKKCDLFDALTGEKLAAGVDQFDYTAQHKETFLFRIENV